MFRFILFILLFGSIVSPSFAQDPITWTKSIVSDSLRKAKKLYPIDMNADGNFDIVAVGSNTSADTSNVVWYENDGNGGFTDHRVTANLFGARAVWAADITGNNYPDILVGAPGDTMLLLFENDGTPGDNDDNWISQPIGSKDSTIYSISTKDLDRDGDQDIVATYYNIDNNYGGDKIRVFYNNGIVSDTLAYSVDTLVQDYEAASSVFVDDINQDGEWDVLSSAGGANTAGNPGKDVSWWENDGSENFTQHSISTSVYGPWHVATADVDGDGDPDVLTAGWGSSELVWWTNDGNGNFGSTNTIVSNFIRARSIQGADIDGDGDTDILGTADDDNTIAWFENDGNQNFTQHTVSSVFHYAYFSYPFDMDGDGDMDILGSAQDDQEIALWKSDLAEEKNIASGDPASESFNNSKVLIDFADGYSGGLTSVFYNHGKNSNLSRVSTSLNHIAQKGYYTIVTAATTYSADMTFYYNGISEWSAISNENDLRICYWDNSTSQWDILKSSNQTVYPADDKIVITGVAAELKKYSLFTLASVSTDNALPVELTSFTASVGTQQIYLKWRTASENENSGFEIWRKNDSENEYELLDSYLSDNALRGLGNSSSGREYIYKDANVFSGETYLYKLFDIGLSGKRNELRRLSVDFVPAMLTKNITGTLPSTVRLTQNWPNPFNQSTRIRFSLPALAGQNSASVSLTVYDIRGRVVKKLFNGQLVSGNYSAFWDGKNQNAADVASGTYIYGLKANDKMIFKRMTLVR